MELFYNPERMTEREIKETFVAHQWLVDEIISILKRQPDGPGVQHVVIVAPRGMGKTTILLMLRFTILGGDVGEQWQSVLFPEESYDVYELADLWLAVLNHIAAETRDIELQDETATITTDASHLEENALARIKNWRAKNGKRLMLLIDNFDMILNQIGDERDNARLRDVLMNDGTLMLVGGATTFFKEARAYDQPLYNLFKIYNLNSLDPNQIRNLLRRRAELDGLKDFDETLRANESRIRVLEYFTGGNPRLVLMLYRIITHSEISEVRRGLEKLLDEVTPYYKAKIESLPPQQRKILDQIARGTSRTREGMTPTNIAVETRLPVNQVSSQLKRLSEAGYVHTANIRGRSSYYTLSEPLYAIWHQMRFGRDARKRMNWLVEFLKNWYDANELGMECNRLQDIFKSYLSAGRQNEARNALEHRRYLMEAIEDTNSKAATFESVIINYLELSDFDTLKSEVLADVDINTLSQETRGLLVKAGVITKDSKSVQAETAAILELAKLALSSGHLKEAKEGFQSALKLDPSNLEAHILLSISAAAEGNTDESQTLLSKLEKAMSPESPALLLIRSLKAFLNNRLDEALQHIEAVLTLVPEFNEAWCFKALILKQAARLPEAVEAIGRIAEEDRTFSIWDTLADLLEELDRNEEAINALNHALRLTPNWPMALRKKTAILAKLDKFDEALETSDRVLSVQPDFAQDWFNRGALLLQHRSPEEALKTLEKAIELDPHSIASLFLKAITLDRLNRPEEGLQSIDRALELNPESADAYFLRGALLARIDPQKGRIALRRAFDIKKRSDMIFGELAVANALRAVVSAESDDVEEVKSAWSDLMRSTDKHSNHDDWLGYAAGSVRAVALAGHWNLAKELIVIGQLGEELFPLARSLDYLLTGDEALIEKLSPEVKQIVNEIVTTMRSANGNQKEKRSRKKSKVNKHSKN